LSLTRGTNTAAALADRTFYTIYAYSPQGISAAALAEFALSQYS